MKTATYTFAIPLFFLLIILSSMRVFTVNLAGVTNTTVTGLTPTGATFNGTD